MFYHKYDKFYTLRDYTHTYYIVRMCIISKCVKLIIFMVEHCLRIFFMPSGSAKWYWAFHHVYVLSWGKFACKINNYLQMYCLHAPTLVLV